MGDKKKREKIKQRKREAKQRKKEEKQQKKQQKQQEKEEARRQKEEEEEERRQKRQELVDAYEEHDSTGESTKTVGNSTLPCKHAKAGIEVTLVSDDRDIEEATVTFESNGSQLRKPVKDLKAFLPLKKAGEVTYRGGVKSPEKAFELDEIEEKADCPEGELTRATLNFETKKCELRVKAHKKGTDEVIKEAEVKLQRRRTKKPVGDDGALFKRLYKETYDVELFVNETDWFKPDPIEARKVEPGEIDDVEDIEVTPRPWIKVKVYDEKKKADMKDVSVFLSFPEEMEGDGATGDDGVVDFRLDKPVADDAKAKLEELFTDEPDEGEGPAVYEFVSHEES